MRVQVARNRVLVYAAVAVMAAAFAFTRTPYSLMLPGEAVNLGHVVRVTGFAEPKGTFFLTDVRFARAVTPLQLLAALAPGVQVIRTGVQVAPDTTTAVEYEGVQREAMSESQSIAAYVAERAAGYRVAQPQSRVLALLFARWSPARGIVHPLDMFVSVNGHPIASTADLNSALSSVRPGRSVRVAVFRHGAERVLSVPTATRKGRANLGIYATTIYQRPELPVAVSYHLPRVAGSSGGLMFALQIYRTLHPLSGESNLRVAGTGTIAYDGSVGPIEGAAQKVAAARKAGATLFLVPQENYAEVKGAEGIRIVPVTNFAQALRAIASTVQAPQ